MTRVFKLKEREMKNKKKLGDKVGTLTLDQCSCIASHLFKNRMEEY
jgi:ribosomal protein L11